MGSHFRCWSLVLSILFFAGCSTYVPPGGKVSTGSLAGTGPQGKNGPMPTNALPASVLMVRAQSSTYTNYYIERNGGKYGVGKYSVVATWDVEEQPQFDRISRLPQVKRVVTLIPSVLPDRFYSGQELCLIAQHLQAEMIFVYTFDTSFYGENPIQALGGIPVGLFQSQKVSGMTTASGVLFDARTGFIYFAVGSEEKANVPSKSLRSKDAADRARIWLEKGAFNKLIEYFECSWPYVLSVSRRKDAASANVREGGVIRMGAAAPPLQ